MILRVYRAHVVAGEEARLARFVRDEALAPALQVPGLISFQPAIRETGDGVELVLVSTWTGFDRILDGGTDLDRPLSLMGAADMLEKSHAEHYELVIGEARAMPLHDAKLRLTRIPIVKNMEARYYDTVRSWAETLLDQTGMVAFSLGRRVIGQQDDIVAVQVWQDEAALVEAAGVDIAKPMGTEELSTFWAAEPEIEHFDALTATEPRRDAPAILLVDDERRYVHATPAAARLTGRPLARLLTMRVEDLSPESDRPAVVEMWRRFLAEGSMEGPYPLHRPDGSTVEVLYQAKANAPWPGSHASLLVPAGETASLDLDKALADAGLVARYAASGT